MPKELIAIAPRTLTYREYEERPLRPDEVRIQSSFSSPSHGTELRSYNANTMDYTAPFDRERRIHVKGAPHPLRFPKHLGDTTIGIVTEVGKEVTHFHKGDRVYGYLPIRETHTVSEKHTELEQRLYLAPEGMSPEAIVYATNPANVALNAVHDARICLGDKVAVFGLGAIGQMVVQIARLQGARWIVASDPIALRRKAAVQHGADIVLNPMEEDVGLIIKDRTDKKGVDVSFETSGNYSALNDALRATRYGGAIVTSGYYPGSAQDLHLEGEWHRNRFIMISSRTVSEPLRDYPRWDARRVYAEAFELLKEGKVSVEGLVIPIVPFDKAAKAFQEINEVPKKSIKLGIVYPK